MAKESVPPTPVPMGDPAKDVVAQEGFCATIIDTKRLFQEPDPVARRIFEELVGEE